MPKGEGHCIAHSEDQPCTPFFDMPVTRLTERFKVMRFGGNGPGGENTGAEDDGTRCRTRLCALTDSTDILDIHLT